jgi:hypothetical protein
MIGKKMGIDEDRDNDRDKDMMVQDNLTQVHKHIGRFLLVIRNRRRNHPPVPDAHRRPLRPI